MKNRAVPISAFEIDYSGRNLLSCRGSFPDAARDGGYTGSHPVPDRSPATWPLYQDRKPPYEGIYWKIEPSAESPGTASRESSAKELGLLACNRND